MTTRANIKYQQTNTGTSVIHVPHFYVILTRQFIYQIILFIQGHLQG